MELVVLGSGSSVPHKRRASSSHWLSLSEGTILLDPSPDAPHRMAEEDLDWASLDAIWVGHFHLDHVGGLAPLLFSMRHAPQTQSRTKPLSIFGAKGLKRLIQRFSDAHDYKLFAQPFPLEIKEVKDGSSFQILPKVLAVTKKTPHTEESLAVRLEDSKGSSMVYSSDTGYSEDLARFASKVDLLLLECSFFKNKPVQTHLELSEAVAIAQEAGARLTVLSHLYPEWDSIDLEAEALKMWDGKVIEARDGLRLDVSFREDLKEL
jgi:ribonuclease BN (tRNA processing enzyme)